MTEHDTPNGAGCNVVALFPTRPPAKAGDGFDPALERALFELPDELAEHFAAMTDPAQIRELLDGGIAAKIWAWRTFGRGGGS